LSGIYNYFDSQFHPYYQDTNLHTMQSVTKTITSVITGVAMHRDEFRAEMDAPILQFFDISTIKNLDDRKRRVTLRDLLTMRSGLDWDEDVPYYDPRNGRFLHVWGQPVAPSEPIWAPSVPVGQMRQVDRAAGALVLTGARKSEILERRIRDVDVVASLDAEGREYGVIEIRKAKTKAGERVLLAANPHLLQPSHGNPFSTG